MTFSRCHSCLCHHTLTFSSLRSVGNKAAGIPLCNKTQPCTAAIFYIFVKYRSGETNRFLTSADHCQFLWDKMCHGRRGGLSWFVRNNWFDLFVMTPEVQIKEKKKLHHPKPLACATLCLISFFEASINESHLFCKAVTLKTQRQRTMSATWAVYRSSRWR